MKKNLFKLIFLMLLCLYACRAKEYAIMGMQESEFVQRNSRAERVQATENVTIYKISLLILGSNRRNIKYYYFVNSKLTRIDEGERQPDILIENTHKN